MAISQRERFVEKVGNLIEVGYRTKTIVNALQFKAGKTEDGSVMLHDGLPYCLRKAQANNLVRQVRKARGLLQPLGKAGNYTLMKEAERFRQRQKQLQKSFNVSSEVIKKNHLPVKGEGLVD